MKVIVALAALAVVVSSGPVPDEEVAKNKEDGANMDYFLVEKSKGVFEVEDLVNSEIDARAAENDITYHFFSARNPSEGTVITSNTIRALRNTRFSVFRDTLFLVHGWLDHYESDFNVRMREAILSQHDINLFIVDWSPIASRNYISARYAVGDVGKHLAEFVRSLASIYRLNVARVAFVGHSLGAHVSGNAGAALGSAPGLIVGLDPAGPLFSEANIDNRLDPTDAKIVHVIHTNGGLLGVSYASGHADYYPNGGSSQPGCILDIAGACAHARAYMYYAESVSKGENQFVSTHCSSYLLYRLGFCSARETALMAGYNIDESAQGDYYLETNSRSPFAKVPEVATNNQDGANMEYFLVETSKWVFKVEDLVNSEINATASETDLTYHFFSAHNSDNGTVITSDTIQDLRSTRFNALKSTVFLIHGWLDNHGSDFSAQLREAILSRHDINLFIVDWSPIARRNYLTARNSVGDIGKYLAEFVKSLISIYRLNVARVGFIGHSLGAHVSGNAGAALDGEPSLIVGLDPAGPLFSEANIDDRLDPTDAKFVHVIHTNAGLLGVNYASGHADYYPNGGSSQPGCILDIAGACAHSRSHIYYLESIANSESKFVATPCESYLNYTKGYCSASEIKLMAGYDVDRTAQGNYYLETNRRSPYAKGQ
ncbi:hypothetical protein NQ318_021559 [Aromia moschata]|uniref:Lipase domain-containing protein n=1 Tax=Aromia moschata TaxID=1265417 RepID=A0AAV8YKF8_9CUCU|nr:hypothetical protein NQ318_021559 [Aromia moschata]